MRFTVSQSKRVELKKKKIPSFFALTFSHPWRVCWKKIWGEGKGEVEGKEKGKGKGERYEVKKKERTRNKKGVFAANVLKNLKVSLHSCKF